MRNAIHNHPNQLGWQQLQDGDNNKKNHGPEVSPPFSTKIPGQLSKKSHAVVIPFFRKGCETSRGHYTESLCASSFIPEIIRVAGQNVNVLNSARTGPKAESQRGDPSWHDRECSGVLYPLHGKAGAHINQARNAADRTFVKIIIAFHVGDLNLHQVIVLSRHAIK